MGTKVKAIELVFDWNLWPRHTAQRLDSTNIAAMKESLLSGFTLPPVVVNKADMRIVDGFHRVKAYMSIHGDDAEIEVEFREYKDEREMFLDAGALNAAQGLKLSPQDRAHFIIKCRKMKVSPKAVAAALHMDSERMQEFLAKRSAKSTDGESIALPGGAKALAGKALTPVQEHYSRTANGVVPEMYTAMLINALRADALVLTERSVRKLTELRDLINQVLEGAAS